MTCHGMTRPHSPGALPVPGAGVKWEIGGGTATAHEHVTDFSILRGGLIILR